MIEELRRFLLVAKNGNVTKTAEAIFMTQSALSQSLKRLEKNLGTKLFIQKGKTLYLTSDGMAVREIGERILTLWENAKQQKIRNTIRPKFAIGVFDNAALRLSKYFQKIIKQDTLTVDLTIESSGDLFSKLQLGLLDLAICVIDQKFKNNNIILVQSFTEELIPVSKNIMTQNIKELPFILYNKASFSREYIDEQFTKKRVTPKVFAESTSVTFMKELALLGCGVALLPKNSVKLELQKKILKKQNLPLRWYRSYGLYLPKHGKLKPDDLLVKDIVKSLKD